MQDNGDDDNEFVAIHATAICGLFLFFIFFHIKWSSQWSLFLSFPSITVISIIGKYTLNNVNAAAILVLWISIRDNHNGDEYVSEDYYWIYQQKNI